MVQIDQVQKLGLDEDMFLDELISNSFKNWEMQDFLTKSGKELLKSYKVLDRELNKESMIRRIWYLHLSQKLKNQMLYKTDRSSMALGVEARPMLLDNRIIDYIFDTKPDLDKVPKFHRDRL